MINVLEFRPYISERIWFQKIRQCEENKELDREGEYVLCWMSVRQLTMSCKEAEESISWRGSKFEPYDIAGAPVSTRQILS